MSEPSFRKLPKVSLKVWIPAALAEEIVLSSARDRRPDNEIVSDLLCRALEIDPERFGIRPRQDDRATTSAT